VPSTPFIPRDLQSKIQASSSICGSDECGLGSWCGPLSVCAAVVHRDWACPGLTDSKRLSRKVRERLYPKLIEQVVFCVVHIYADEFDQLRAGRAWFEGHTRAVVGALERYMELGELDAPVCIIDGTRPIVGCIPLPKADLLIPAVSAASVIAKCQHDWIMDRLDQEYQGYDLSKNSGYGTMAHRAALARLGVSPAHRRSYAPMLNMIAAQEQDSLTMLGELDS
jgi:ribonuclease HII